MAENKYDLTVAYRIYPKVSKIPPVFTDDKYKLSELCLRSFKKSLGNLKVKIYVLMDNCPKEYEKLFTDIFPAEDLQMLKLSGLGNHNTFNEQVNLLLDQQYSEYVYFAEDDYFYLPGLFNEMINLLKNNEDVHFVTAFDHPHYYNYELHCHKNIKKVYEGRKWRTVNSTCLTFLTKKDYLKKTEWVFKTYKYKNNDSSLWLSLTKYRVFNPLLPLKYFIKREWFLLEIILFSWLFCWWQILFGKKWNLWAPYSSIATHMNSNLMAPNIDWNKYFNKERYV